MTWIRQILSLFYQFVSQSASELRLNGGILLKYFK